MSPPAGPTGDRQGSPRVFDTVLVADRGPVAVRVVRACQQLGVQAVAVHCDRDGGARHVALADEAVLLGPVEGYRDPTRMVEAARQSRAQAVHPGGGPLAEDPVAGRAVRDAGLAWVGPDPEALEHLALPALAAAAGISAGHGPGTMLTVHVLGRRDGQPVVLTDSAVLPTGLAEIPAPGLPPELRAALAGAAVRVVVAARLAGPVAVALRTADRGGIVLSGVQARLPRHPMVELATGVDLVRQQLLLAAGEPLSYEIGTGAAVRLRVSGHEGPWTGPAVDGVVVEPPDGAEPLTLTAGAPDRAGARARLRAALEGSPLIALLDDPYGEA